MLYWSIAVQSHGLVKYRYINASLINRLNIWSIKYELVYTHEWVLITLIMHSIFLEEMLNWLWSHVSDIFWETFSFHILCTLESIFVLLIIRKNKAFGLKCAFIISSHSQICISWPLKNADINKKCFLKLF